MKVRDAMAKAVSSARRSDKVIDVARKMKQEDAGFIPVLENGGTLIGVIADRDIVIRCIAEGHDPRSETAEHLMSREVTIIAPDDDLEQAARMMECGVLSHGNLVQATKNKTTEKVTEGVTRGA
jgi:CBS domain-containing protein